MMMKSWSVDIKVNEGTVICFDLDDTIYNELDFLKSAYKEIAFSLSAEDGMLVYAKMFSLYRNGKDVFGFLTSNFNCNKDELLQLYREHIPNIKTFKGIDELFDQIKNKNGKLALITDGRSITQRNKLKALGIAAQFDKIVISEELGSQKPNEQNYIAIEQHFQRDNYTYVADNFKKDFIVPNQRGWGSVGLVDNGKNIHYNAFGFADKKHRPQQLITNINQIKII